VTDYPSVFDAASTEFSRLAPIMWNPLGEHLVRLAAPAPGERVLDVCCGAGASALPAARAVGPTGLVDAIDLSVRLLALGHSASGDVPWLRFVHADATTWTTEEPYDLVQSGYGVFFLPGGRFAVLAWRRGSIVSYATCLANAVEQVRGEPPQRANTSQASARIHTTQDLERWLASLGLTSVRAEEFDFQVPLTGSVAWDLVLGTGFRDMIAGLTPAETERVRDSLLRRLTDEGIDHLEAGSVMGVGTVAS
jgi:trans-aconitate methyltransferase